MFSLVVGPPHQVFNFACCCACCVFVFRLGGVGHTVQIDECQIAKRKYNRGRLVPDQWIFGMYDVNAGVGVVRYVLNRSRATILPIIEEYVLPGLSKYSKG